MFRKIGWLASVLAMVFLVYPQEMRAAEDIFTSREFLTWPEEKQDGYFQISVTMATVIATQAQSNAASCLNEWYFKDVDKQNQHMREVLRDHPDFHPSGTIFAIIQKACGDIIP